jgi:hypothetical protein
MHWVADNRMHLGRYNDATVTSAVNDVGLLSEEYDLERARAWGSSWRRCRMLAVVHPPEVQRGDAARLQVRVRDKNRTAAPALEAPA